MVRMNVARALQRNADASPAEVVRNLERMYRCALIGLGAGIGALAAPATGTGAARALAEGEALSTIELGTLFVLSLAEVHGVPAHELERRRTLVIGVVLGGSGSSLIPKLAARTGTYWGRQLVARVPGSALKPINDVFGPNFVTKNGTKAGVVVLGVVAPSVLGAAIGSGANGLLAELTIHSARRAFGPAPDNWGRDRNDPPPALAA
jgi:hypothetical protein